MLVVEVGLLYGLDVARWRPAVALHTLSNYAPRRKTITTIDNFLPAPQVHVDVCVAAVRLGSSWFLKLLLDPSTIHC